MTRDRIKKIVHRRPFWQRHRNHFIALTDVAELIASISLPQNPPGEAECGGIDGMSAIKTADFQYLRWFEGINHKF
jgi:hypothetical protein